MHVILLALTSVLSAAPAAPTSAPLLELEARIPLGKITGRLDHLAFDAAHNRVFVAEHDSGTVGVVDLTSRKVTGRIEGLEEPQGLGWLPDTQLLYVGCGGGKLRAFHGGDLSPAGVVDLGEDVDNIRVDRATRRLFVGYGEGGIAAIDGNSLQVVAKAELHGHPEGFQLAAQANRVFVNVPAGAEIAVVDVTRKTIFASWPMGVLHDNYPMALDNATQRVFSVFRRPSVLAAFSMVDGRELAKAPTCRDADDVFLDASRKRLYVICGEGVIDIRDPKFALLGQFKTVAGARTGLFVADADRLFLAVRAQGSENAAVWVLAPKN